MVAMATADTSTDDVTELPESVVERYGGDRVKTVTALCKHCDWSTTVRACDVDDSVYREAAWRAGRHEEMLGRHLVADFTVEYIER
ncbi:hypothetical protein PN419_00200 [Halorubrum ezzemoulense]|uniref:hypothetical protein n=1 Tax=Halorubrum ezzemoulense TaxID=337243 RepID=UPI00232D6A3B|nr:hypothetical protein [Halorubrum ezzemoulense]MDB9247427.1 hypothetical protein [Halorubrum ezzemoulense]MDB9258664.1 hypothetical protein [Halorubrum ezzemoulense]MDB9264478.1 hypothetical protein [Halorubrum ezzemoulense]MDB9269025.1 hypothetical protein [Halorubrum ezzemoulense]MDB9271446.1 hypothetical protein [Halorubrum ezzemoulense]